jgi:hypothetical protein
MKKVPLVRRTPLRSKEPGLKRSPLLRKTGLPYPARKTKLKPMSQKKIAWKRQYAEEKKLDTFPRPCRCPDCKGRKWERPQMDPHHPMGQAGAHILIYVWVCRPFHTWIHDHGQRARELGYLQPEFDGRKGGPDTPDPLRCRGRSA